LLGFGSGLGPGRPPLKYSVEIAKSDVEQMCPSR
jgi:hypothetical protein